MNARRWIALPIVAAIAVVAVVAVQLANGGGRYEPLTPPAACVEREVESQVDGIEGLGEELVLIGLADAACSLGVTREELTLELAQAATLTDTQEQALRDGLRSAVEELDAADALPPVSTLVDETVARADLNRFVEIAIGAVPNGVIDAALPTRDLLDRAIEELDLGVLVDNVADPDAIEAEIQRAITQSVVDTLLGRLRDLLP